MNIATYVLYEENGGGGGGPHKHMVRILGFCKSVRGSREFVD
jgi:hypothetical protein